MSVIGVVCEFNPFHNGHKHLIDSVKKHGDTVVCVMSGNYVQRGEPAIFPKDIRVKSALLNGADIVLELPLVYATASAEIFAKSAVKILASFGCDKIAFGTENTSLEELNNAVDILSHKDFYEKVGKYLTDGVSYPTARQMAFNEHNCECDISLPNNILAIEYINSIRKNNYKTDIIAVDRKGAGYNDNCAVDQFASATYIRNLIKENKDFSKFVPENSYELYKSAIENENILSDDKFNLAALTLLHFNGCNSKTANMAEGLENRIESAVKSSVSLNGIYDKAKTKRFTHSRIRRAVLSSILGITEDDLQISVPYCRLLGFNQSANSVLGISVKKCELPFVVNYSDIQKLNSKNVNRIFETESKSTDLYNLSLQKTAVYSTEKTFSVIKMK